MSWEYKGGIDGMRGCVRLNVMKYTYSEVVVFTESSFSSLLPYPISTIEQNKSNFLSYSSFHHLSLANSITL